MFIEVKKVGSEISILVNIDQIVRIEPVEGELTRIITTQPTDNDKYSSEIIAQGQYDVLLNRIKNATTIISL